MLKPVSVRVFSFVPFLCVAMVSGWEPPAKGDFCGSGKKNLDQAVAATFLQNILKNQPDLASWETHAAKLRAGMLKQIKLSPLPPRTPLKAVIHSKRLYKGYSVENVFFESLPGFFVTGNLYRPLTGTAPFPAILTTHGHSNADRLKGVPLRSAILARMGAVVLAIDMVGHGESDQVSHCFPEAAVALATWNSMSSIDFLLSLEGIDPTRIGMTGESGGATTTFVTTALDARITHSAPVVMVSAYSFGGCNCESGMSFHKGPDYETVNAEIAALAAPRAQLVVSDGQDWTKNVPKVEFPFLQSVYGYFGKKDDVENVHLANEGHNFGPNKRVAVYAFFQKRFRLLPPPPESEVSAIPMDSLRVFPPDHPRPAYALKTKEEILAALFNPPNAVAPRHATPHAAAPAVPQGAQTLFERTRQWFNLLGRIVKPSDAP